MDARLAHGKPASPPPAAQPSAETPQFALPPPSEQVQSVRFDFNDPLRGPSTSTGIGGSSGAGLPCTSASGLFTSPNTQAPDAAPEDQSFGTLVISQSGRSKYLGPTAASEWLKDVSSKRRLGLMAARGNRDAARKPPCLASAHRGRGVSAERAVPLRRRSQNGVNRIPAVKAAPPR